ncbi:hypothetical protein IV203_010915 [Nitzschia inconspicua]|uniref:Uncharacterized protein n=1 Tax=Nitzschia inconspicua TaxID=303405 RepID=A0A9K3KYQ9_9STRA|nr:hypothetical protein IV203_010915 [Nitzschia inconspicua]
MSFNYDCKRIPNDHNLILSAVNSLTVRELVLHETVSCYSDISCDDLTEDDTCMQQSDSFHPAVDSPIIRTLRWEASNHSKHSVDSVPMCYGNKRQRPAERSNTSKDLPFRAPIRYTEKERNIMVTSAIVSPPSSRWFSQSQRFEDDILWCPLRQEKKSYSANATEFLQRTVCLLDAALDIVQDS